MSRHVRFCCGRLLVVLALLSLPFTGCAKPANQSKVTAFVNVNVVPMDEARVGEGQTVIVIGNRIAEIGPAGEIDVPVGAHHIDSRGKYLMPGLAEMHGHLPGPQWSEKETESILFLYVANGVTTVRGMQGDPSQFALRERIENGEILGPRLYLGSPALSGNRVTAVSEAHGLVRQYKEAGFDLLKVQEGLSPRVYDAIVAAAKEVGIPFAGHVPDRVALLHALQSGQATIDHLDNFIEALVPVDPKGRDDFGPLGVWKLVENVDEDKIPEVVEATHGAGAYVVPTMVLWETFFGGKSSEELHAERPWVRHVPLQMVERWGRRQNRLAKEIDGAAGGRVIELRREILTALYEAGVKILLGTDSPQIFSVPGFSIHGEMKLYVEIGMTPYDVLVSGTRNVAEYFKATDDFGTVSKGKRADLILLRANPLEDVGNVGRREGVMVNGQWIPESEIQQRLADIATRFASQ